jgi:hypothetical protein
MHARLLLLTFVVFSLTTVALAAEPKPILTKQNPDGSIPGWKAFSEDPKTTTADVWKLNADGVLVCKGTPKGYLFTEKSYADFVLTLEWRSPPDKKPGAGGVLFRIVGPNKIWPKSLEAQLNAGGEGDFWGLDGFALDGPAARKKVIETSPFGKLTNLPRTKDAVKKPGEWNTYEIIAQGGTVILKINGQEVNRAEHCDTAPGPICLTSEGDEIHFRNVKLLVK